MCFKLLLSKQTNNLSGSITRYVKTCLFFRLLSISLFASLVVACNGDSEGLVEAKTGVRGDIEVTFSWTIPNTRENGDRLPLSEIQGYELHLWKVGSDTLTEITISDPTMSVFTINDLSAENYQFQVAAIDTDNLYSRYSEVYSVDLSDY